MPVRKCQQILLEFGLKPNQAKVYLATVQLGIAPVSQISQACGVRREDTYRALSKLEKIGIVEKITDEPTQVRALPVEETLTLLTKNWKQTVSEKERTLTLKRQEFLKQFEAEKEIQPPKEEGHYALLLERSQVLAKVMEMLKTTEKEIDAITCAGEIPQMLPVFSETLSKQGGKQIKARVILETPDEKKTFLADVRKHLPPSLSVELRYAYKLLSHYCIVDFRSVLLATTREPSMGKVPYLWTDAPDFVKLMKKHFEELWQSSRSLKTADAGI